VLCKRQFTLVVQVPRPLGRRPIHVGANEPNGNEERFDSERLVRREKLDGSVCQPLVRAVGRVVLGNDARTVLAAKAKALVVPDICNERSVGASENVARY
jgi:hypothetical protein